jgi:hypothetical protein
MTCQSRESWVVVGLRETGLLNLLLSGAHGEDLNHGLVRLRVLTSDAKDRGIERALSVLRPVHMAV